MATAHMERGSTSLIIRERQVDIAMRYRAAHVREGGSRRTNYQTQQIPSVAGQAEHGNPCALSAGCKPAQPRQKAVPSILRKLKVKLSQVLAHSGVPPSKATRTTNQKNLPYDAAVPPLVTCPKEPKSASQRHVCTPVCTAAFSPGARSPESTQCLPRAANVSSVDHISRLLQVSQQTSGRQSVALLLEQFEVERDRLKWQVCPGIRLECQRNAGVRGGESGDQGRHPDTEHCRCHAAVTERPVLYVPCPSCKPPSPAPDAAPSYPRTELE